METPTLKALRVQRPKLWESDRSRDRDRWFYQGAEAHLELTAAGLWPEAELAVIDAQARQAVADALAQVRDAFAGGVLLEQLAMRRRQVADARVALRQATERRQAALLAARRALVAGDDPAAHEHAARSAAAEAQDLEQRITALEGLLQDATGRAKRGLRA